MTRIRVSAWNGIAGEYGRVNHAMPALSRPVHAPSTPAPISHQSPSTPAPAVSLPPLAKMREVADNWDEYGLPPLDELKLPREEEEAAGTDPTDVDTRADVYALGVVAYRLLAGRAPYDVSGLWLDEAARVVRRRALQIDGARLAEYAETITKKALEEHGGDELALLDGYGLRPDHPR